MSRAKKKSKRRLKSLRKNAKRFAAYSAAAAATAMTTQDRSANAAEVVWDILDVHVSAAAERSFNFLSGGSLVAPYVASWNNYEGSFLLAMSGSYPLMYAPVGDTNAAIVAQTGGFVSTAYVYVYASFLPVTANVGASRSFGANRAFAPSNYGNYAWMDTWNLANPDVAGVVGLRFDIGGATHYGWMQVTASEGDAIVHGFGYNDTPGATSQAVDTDELFGDLNRDDDINPDDWEIFRDNNPQDLSGEVTALDAYLKGDLDRDFDNDISDFVLFQEAYDNVNGAGSFADMVASIPEPNSMLLLAAGAAGLGMWRRKKGRHNSSATS